MWLRRIHSAGRMHASPLDFSSFGGPSASAVPGLTGNKPAKTSSTRRKNLLEMDGYNTTICLQNPRGAHVKTCFGPVVRRLPVRRLTTFQPSRLRASSLVGVCAQPGWCLCQSGSVGAQSVSLHGVGVQSAGVGVLQPDRVGIQPACVGVQPGIFPSLFDRREAYSQEWILFFSTRSTKPA